MSKLGSGYIIPSIDICNSDGTRLKVSICVAKSIAISPMLQLPSYVSCNYKMFGNILFDSRPIFYPRKLNVIETYYFYAYLECKVYDKQLAYLQRFY